MMTVDLFLKNVGVLLAVMALLGVVEAAVPFFRNDWRRRHLAPNFGLTAMTLGLNFVFNAGAVVVTACVTSRGLGLLSGVPLGPVAMTLLAVFVLDASTYACHRLMHALPPLWEAHRVHHSDPVVDVTTTLRFHPIETAWRFAFIIVPVWALGLPVTAVATYRVISAFMALFEHMNVKVWQPLDTALSLVVGTPNMHKVHHSSVVTETDTNYGNILSLFDRALGTFTPSARADLVECGLPGHDSPELQELGGLLQFRLRRADAAPRRA